VPKLLRARAPEDTEEERKIHKLAGRRHAPGDWVFCTRVVSLSRQGLRTARIAEELGCHPKTVSLVGSKQALQNWRYVGMIMPLAPWFWCESRESILENLYNSS
jgi:hypothetical protein